MKIIALVPMKGNSERVHNKNIRDFNGKPLFYYVISELLKSRYIDQVIVNTDSETISSKLNQFFEDEVHIHSRPDSLKGDYVSMNNIIEYDINCTNGDIYIQTHSTNPLLKVDTIDLAIEKILNNEGDIDSVFSVSKIQKRFFDDKARPIFHDPKMLVTQHLKPIFEENSCFYVFSKSSFKSNDGRIGNKPFMFEIDKIEAIDIDEKEDFLIAETLHRVLR